MREGDREKLKMLLRALADRIRDREDIRSLSLVLAGDEPEAEVRWPPGSDDLQWKESGKSRPVGPDDLVNLLLARVEGEKSFTIECQERGHMLLITYERGKLSTRLVPSHGQKETVSGVDADPGTRQLFIEAEPASDLLKAVGIMTPEGRIPRDRRRKLYQVDRFVELVHELLQGWPREKELRVVDLGAGKSYLSFVLNYYLTEVRRTRCQVTGVDSNPDVLAGPARVRDRLGYRNMEFVASRILDYSPPRRPHLVMSLHACDTATDEALALGVRHGCSYILAVPCCQAALTDEIQYGPLVPMVRHGALKRRLADILTDGLRASCLEARGYQVNVVEYVSPLDTPKNLMLRARLRGRPLKEKASAYNRMTRDLGVTPWIDRMLRGERPSEEPCHREEWPCE